METEEIEKIVNKGLDGFYEKHKTSIMEEVALKSYQTEDEVKAAIKAITDKYDADIVALQKSLEQGKTDDKPVNFKSAISEGLNASKDELLKMKNGGISNSSVMLTKANEDLDPANWTGDSYELATTERRGLYEFPFAPIWLRDLLPASTSSGGTIQYLKENGNVGAAGVWDGTGPIGELTAKPGTAPLFDMVTENIFWIAGITRVKREMLDDIPWLQGYLSRRLLTGRTGLFVAENTQILSALNTNSTAYDGAETSPLKIIYDAAFGQLRDNYYNPSFILMNSRDLVTLIAFTNGTSLSDDFTLPSGVVTYINGQLTIGGVPVIGQPGFPQGNFLVVDRNATEFISRMNPEVRFFEQDRDNVPKNLITVRAEERILPIVYDELAVISGSFTPST